MDYPWWARGDLRIPGGLFAATATSGRIRISFEVWVVMVARLGHRCDDVRSGQ